MRARSSPAWSICLLAAGCSVGELKIHRGIARDSGVTDAAPSGKPPSLPPLCGPSCDVLASDLTGPRRIVLDARNVYWLNDGPGSDGIATVETVRKDGGAPTVLASGTYLDSLAANGDGVYWTTHGIYAEAALMALPAGFGTATALVPPDSVIVDVAADTTSVYWASSALGEERDSVKKIPAAGGPTTLLGSGWNISEIAVAGGYVYWVDGGPEAPDAGSRGGTLPPSLSEIVRVPIDGGGPEVLVPLQEPPIRNLEAHPPSIYWLEPAPDGGGSRILVIPIDPPPGGPAVPIPHVMDSGANPPVSLAVDDSGVYFTTELVDGRMAVMKVGASGPVPSEIVSVRLGLTSLALDETSVYWAAESDSTAGPSGTVMKVAKQP